MTDSEESSAVSDSDASELDDSSTDESTDSNHHERGSVDLTSQRLQSMHAVSSNVKKSVSTYAANGRSKTRIKNRLAHPICKCRCALPLRAVLKVALAFWMLTKQGQDSVLWAIQRENPGNSSKKDWFIEGLLLVDVLFNGNCNDAKSILKHVRLQLWINMLAGWLHHGHSAGYPCCKVAWMHLLGVGKKRLSRCKDVVFGKDGRSTFGRPLFECSFWLSICWRRTWNIMTPWNLWALVVNIPHSAMLHSHPSLRSGQQTCREISFGSCFLLAHVLVSRGTDDYRATYLRY